MSAAIARLQVSDDDLSNLKRVPAFSRIRCLDYCHAFAETSAAS